MTNKHTPGPWSMNGPTLVGNGYNIGSVNSHRTSEGEANASLIAAAPDLLAALDSVLLAHRYDGALTTGTALLSPAILGLVERAIAKATGSAS